MCVSTSGVSSSCLCPNGFILSIDESTCEKEGLISNPSLAASDHLASSKLADISSSEDEKFLILLIVGTVGGSMFLILLVRFT